MKDFIGYTSAWFIVLTGAVIAAILGGSFIVWELPSPQRVIEAVPEVTRIILVLSVICGLITTISELAKK